MSAAAGAVRAIEALGTASLPDPQQLEFLRQPDGSLPVNAINLVRGKGRPKGARNKRSRKIADYYVQRYGDPLDAVGQMANTPLRQLIEVLMEADGSAEREARLLEGVDQAVAHIKALALLPGEAKGKVELAEQLSDAIDKLALAASRISGKPGKLALDALALQMQAHVKALEYVHGKRPIAIDARIRSDMVIFAPELLKAHGIDPFELQERIAKNGLEGLDADDILLGDYREVEAEPDGEEAE